MNVEMDQMMGAVIDTAARLGWNASNTYIIFNSDHGEMNMEHRQIWKNSMYEASSRIPFIIAGPGVEKDRLVKNFTQIMDVLPTLMEIGGVEQLPGYLSGYSLSPLFTVAGDSDSDSNADTSISSSSSSSSSRPDFITAQYHSNMANTGTFMVRRGAWKYIQFGHFLKAYAEYPVLLFNVDEDEQELTDLSNEYPDIVSEMDAILLAEYDYEYVDCIAKLNDFQIFEKYYWNVYNQTALFYQFVKVYEGFDEQDWQTVVEWRDELLQANNTCVGRALSL
jgi:arylsulfatase K